MCHGSAGLEFDELPELEQAEALQGMAVFCRVEPSHKQRLVELLKAPARSRPFHSPPEASCKACCRLSLRWNLSCVACME